MSESDDSDAEGGLGNVTRVVLRPPGHSGKAKRGHLCFDASYEGGNLGRVDFISEFEYDLFIRPDTCNPRYRMWFNFVVDNVRADQRVIFNLVNLCKIKTLFRDGMTPLVKTSSRPKWQRLPGKYVYYHKSPEHRNHYILSFAFAFDREEDVYQFAFSFPYSYSRSLAHLELLQQRDFPHFKREVIGASLQNRNVEVITTTNLEGEKLVGGKRPKVVVILARTNAGETPGSYVAQGLMDFMVSSHPLAVTLRDHIIIKIIPMINPDGAYLGNYRTSLMGYDLNRHWNQVSPWSHPALNAVKNFLLDLDASKSVDLDMVLDLHAHASLMGAFIYGNAYDDVYRFERHILFPKLLAHNAEDYNAGNTMYNRDPNKAGTARRHLCEILRNTVNVYALEVSYFGYTQPLSNSIITYNEDGYLRLGRNLARTLFEYYKVTGIIPAAILNSLPQQPPEEGEKVRSVIRRKARPKGRKSGSKSREKSQTRSPSNPREAHSNSSYSNVNENEDEKGDKAVVKLSQLTRETAPSPDSSDMSTSDEEVKVRATRNGTIFQQHYIKRRPKAPANANMSHPDTTPLTNTNGNAHNLNNHNEKGGLGKSQGRGEQLISSISSTTPSLKKPAYRTFDFSILKQPERLPRARRFTHKRSENEGRKIGGGGLVGKRRGQVRRDKERAGGKATNLFYNSETDTDNNSPCLTIIDFNMLIRRTLEVEGRKERGWRGRKSLVARAGPGHTSEGEELLKRRSNVRRRRAILLRGTLTDGSTWEDGDASSESSTDNDDEEKEEAFNFPCEDETGNLVSEVGGIRHVNFQRRRRLRKRSTPTLSPSPIFLPQ